MRVDFQNGGTTQQPVTPAQSHMRHARARKRPVLRVLILLLIVGAIGAGAWWYTRQGTVYTYGLVAARMTPYYAPFEGVVGDLDLERGDYVSKGQELFTLTSTQPENVKEAQDALLAEIDRQKQRAADARENLIAQAEKDVARLQAAYDDEMARRQAAVDTAESEAAKLKDLYTSRQQRADRVAELYDLGAAVRSDLEAARDAAQLARHNWQQAELSLRLAQERAAVDDSALKKAQLELDRLNEGDPSDTTDLDRDRVALAVAQTRPAPAAIRSLFDGVVMEVGAIDGAQVENGRVVATIATRDNIWVEAYVPPKQANMVRAGGKALVYLPGHDEPIDGTIAENSGAAVRVPEILRDKLPSLMMGVYARVNFTPPEGDPVVPGSRVRVVIPGSGPGL